MAVLTIRNAEAFEAFERQAIAIMKNYGGTLESAFTPETNAGKEGDAAEELHILHFPDRDAFDRYRADEQLASLASLREEAISDTSVYISAQHIDYSE